MSILVCTLVLNHVQPLAWSYKSGLEAGRVLLVYVAYYLTRVGPAILLLSYWHLSERDQLVGDVWNR